MHFILCVIYIYYLYYVWYVGINFSIRFYIRNLVDLRVSDGKNKKRSLPNYQISGNLESLLTPKVSNKR